MLNPIAALLIAVLDIYKWVVIAAVIVSWLTTFNVINSQNNFVRSLLIADDVANVVWRVTYTGK